MYAFMHLSLRWTKGGEFIKIFLKIFFMNDPGARGMDVYINPDSSPTPSFTQRSSVPDPDPAPDPHVFGPQGSGSISQRYGSGSGSFYHKAKIVRKTLISTVL
jgi:hypothetical protein